MRIHILSGCRVLRAWPLLVACALLCTAREAPAEPATAPAATTPAEAVTAPATRPASAPATSQPATAPALPEADSFKASDCPSDNGGEIVVQWAKPAGDDEGVKYVVEVARSPQDFTTGNFKSKTVDSSSPNALAFWKPEVFGYDEANRHINFVLISPAALFPPPAPPTLTAERLKALAAEGVISAEDLARAQRILENKKKVSTQPATSASAESGPATEPAADTRPATQASSATSTSPATGSAASTQPTAAEDEAWFGHLAEYVRSRDWLAGFAAPNRNDLTGEQLTRALAALEAEYKGSTGTPESDWLERLQAFLKKKDQAERKVQAAATNGQTWYFRLAALQGEEKTYLLCDGQPAIVSAQAKPNLFKWFKLNNLIFSLLFCTIVAVFIQVAKRRPDLFIRKIAGLEAVDEAIGRSTEMDRPVFFVHGLGDMSGLATIASVNVLSRVARRTAEHDSHVRVMNSDPIVTAVSQEVVQQAYTEAGRPDAFNPDEVSLVANDQFSYVAAVSGNMVREQPGAIFLFGTFFAESLLLSETGASTGAIQIAGTDSYTQLPFFVTTCDYTLMGEELYAASAYLSREPRLLGSLRGQDVGKAFMMIAMVVGTLVLTAATFLGSNANWLRSLFRASG